MIVVAAVIEANEQFLVTRRQAGVHLAGRVAHERAADWIAAADAVCQPSLVEPFGQAILEALASERSVVATRVGGPPEFVPPGAGVLVDPTGVEAIAEGLRAAAALPSPNPAAREAALRDLGDRFFADLAAGRSDDPVLRAVVHTVRAYGHDPDCFRRFLASMAMDLTVSTYATWDDLLGYMDGSAAVIGEMMLPILEPHRHDEALVPARDLGFAFQLTNFLRDVAEDLDRGRVYLPQEDLATFGADPWRRTVDPTAPAGEGSR